MGIEWYRLVYTGNPFLSYIYIYCKYIFGVDSHPLTLKLLDLMGHIR